MSSILTNNSAMVALQTLKGINSNLMKTQEEISTGKTVGSAKDNAAVWAISKVMEADVQGFKGISDSLSLGSSSVAVARQASETITSLLTDIKSKIVAAQESNVDRAKIQTDIDAARDQIASVVNAAQFNGLNLIKGTDAVDVLSSLDRASDGSVTASSISVARQDMTTSAGVFSSSGTNLTPNVTASAATVASAAKTADITFAGTVATDTASVTVAGVQLNFTAGVADNATTTAAFFTGAINALGLQGVSASNAAGVLTISSTRAFEGLNVQTAATGTGTSVISAVNGGAPALPNTAANSTIEQRAETIALSTTAAVNDGDGYKVTIGSASYDYIAGKGETMEDVAKGLKAAIDSAGVAGITTKVTQDATTKQWSLSVDNDGTGPGGASMAFSSTGLSGGTASGGLFGLDGIDVRTTAGAQAALSNIETMIQSSIDGAATFGSAEGRIKTQSDFVGKLSDALKAGIGSMVDADMEEASARLQALQVQQQLGVQALSIANQSPQSILSLFR
jgi:flagellin